MTEELRVYPDRLADIADTQLPRVAGDIAAAARVFADAAPSGPAAFGDGVFTDVGAQWSDAVTGFAALLDQTTMSVEDAATNLTVLVTQYTGQDDRNADGLRRTGDGIGR